MSVKNVRQESSVEIVWLWLCLKEPTFALWIGGTELNGSPEFQGAHRSQVMLTCSGVTDHHANITNDRGLGALLDRVAFLPDFVKSPMSIGQATSQQMDSKRIGRFKTIFVKTSLANLRFPLKENQVVEVEVTQLQNAINCPENGRRESPEIKCPSPDRGFGIYSPTTVFEDHQLSWQRSCDHVARSN